MTDGQFEIQTFAAGEIVPGGQVLDAVQNGTVEMGHTASYYYVGKNPAFAFGTTVPFMLNARQQNAWFDQGGGNELLDAFFETPRLATAILWAASRDEAMVVEHLVRLGRRDADKRLAHFLLELWSRLTLVGMADRSGYACPLTQFHLADALGLTSVHINRTLRKLREAGLASMRAGRVEIMNLDGLIKLADFDPAYLDQTGPLLV
ncbi:MAG: helix-turn-helix domain-containing protein [Alphaproteobacteria bacterium]|nr:helix-turn-helix domain-containing protein [Alphaproteobacteria bacterium]